MNKYTIADMTIAVKSENLKILRNFSDFQSNNLESENINLSIKTCSKINISKGTLMLNDRIRWIQTNDGSIQVSVFHKSLNKNIASLEVNKEWNNACISYLKNLDENEYPIIESLSEIMFRNSILFNSGIVMHAAVIEWEKKGILFVAPSGTGKSTQANLWKQYKGGKILNGDRGIIRVLNEQPYVYGSPWSGSSPDYMNACVPISSIILIEQSPRNEICKLSSNEAASRLMPRCFLPYYDKNMIEKAIFNLNRIISKTSIYMLKCKPDQEAVELACECVS